VLPPCQRKMLARGTEDKEYAMSQKLNSAIAAIGIDIGKNTFHLVGQDRRGALVLRQKWSRGHRRCARRPAPSCGPGWKNGSAGGRTKE
jgi:transposase